MKRLSEAKVQQVSLDFLRDAQRYKTTGKIYAQKEARTKMEFGRKRADGLIAYRHWLWGTYVISIEAKSYKTLPAIKPYKEDKALFWNSLKTGGFVCIASGAAFAFFKMDDSFYQFLLPLNVFVIASLLYAFKRFGTHYHLDAKVLGQSDQYPADEQWLALSKDSIDAMKIYQVKALKDMCKTKGIGVVLVDEKGRARKWVKPSRRWKFFGNFLEYYSNESKILKAIR